MRNAQNSLDLYLFVKKTLLSVTCIQVAHWYNFIGCNFPYLVDTSLGVRPFGQTYDKRSISIETLQNILNLVPPRRTSKIKINKKKRKKELFCCTSCTGSTGLRVPTSRFRVPSTRRRVPSTSRRVPPCLRFYLRRYHYEYRFSTAVYTAAVLGCCSSQVVLIVVIVPVPR